MQSPAPGGIQDEGRQPAVSPSIVGGREDKVVSAQDKDLMLEAVSDGKTGVANWAAFDARLSLELERSARTGLPIALLMTDVDKFESINSVYGHQAGDYVLRRIAVVLNENVRKVDLVARYNGGEFAIILPATSVEGVSILADRIRKTIKETSISWEGQELGVTLSIGAEVSTNTAGEDDAPNIIKAADEQLYAAKHAGRNRVKVAQDGKTIDRRAEVSAV